MSFDWRAFATGFFEETQDIQKERREEAKQFEEDQRAAVERNAQDISRRRAIANTALSYSRYLIDQGLTEAQIQAAIAAGPDKLAELTSAVQTAVRANGGRPLGASDVDAIMAVPEGFTPVDIDVESYVNQTFGLARAEQPQEQEEFSFLDRFGGRHLMSRTRERLNATPYQDGMTITEINALAQQADYESLIPGTFVTINTPSTYDSETGVAFVETMERLYGRLESTDRFNATAPGSEERQRLIEDTLGSSITAYIGEYGGVNSRFFAAQEPYLRALMGDEYVNSLIEASVRPEEEQTQEPLPATDAEIAADGMSPYDQPIETTTLPPIATPEGDVVVEPEDVPTAEQPPATATEEPQGEAEGVQTEEGYKLRGTDGVEYSYEDWQELTRSQREAAGLPTSVIGAQVQFRRFRAGLGLPPVPESRGATSRGRNEGRTPREDDSETNADGSTSRRSVRAINQLVNEFGVDRGDITFVSRVGGNIQDFALERGVTTLEQMKDAVEAFTAQNNMAPPQSVDVVAQILFENLVDSGTIAPPQQQ